MPSCPTGLLQPWALVSLLSSVSSPRVLGQLEDTPIHLTAASLCPEVCSEFSLPSLRGWCDRGVNVLCYSQAAHLCSPLLASPLTVPSLPHTPGCLPFSQSCTHAGIALLLVLLVERLLQSLLQSHPIPTQALPTLHTPSMAADCTTALCLALPSSPSQQPPCHWDIISKEKWGKWFNLPSLP